MNRCVQLFWEKSNISDIQNLKVIYPPFVAAPMERYDDDHAIIKIQRFIRMRQNNKKKHIAASIIQAYSLHFLERRTLEKLNKFRRLKSMKRSFVSNS
tara:strand:- start:1011 stop:1304 length:294 start_codon:yes stop_codon:yes gene_type:complete